MKLDNSAVDSPFISLQGSNVGLQDRLRLREAGLNPAVEWSRTTMKDI